MDIRHLEAVAEIAKRGSFTLAADALHIAQPTLSKTVIQLEEELGVLLFSREGKRPKLTEAGEAVLRYGGPILSQMDALHRELADLSELRQGTLRLGLPRWQGLIFRPSSANTKDSIRASRSVCPNRAPIDWTEICAPACWTSASC